MLRYTLTSLRASQSRLLLTAVAIVLGVGVGAGPCVAPDPAEAAADAAFRETTPRVDVVVRAAPTGEGEIFSDITGELFANPMPAAVVERAGRVDGVATAIGVVSGNAQLLGRAAHGTGGRAPHPPPTTRGVGSGTGGGSCRQAASRGRSRWRGSWSRPRSPIRSCWSASTRPPPRGCSLPEPRSAPSRAR